MGAVLTLLTGEEAFAALSAAAEEAEESRSQYWQEQVERFSVSADGMQVGPSTIGNTSTKTSLFRDTAHYLLQRPLVRFGRAFPDTRDCERLGRRLARLQDRQFTYDMLRQSLTLALIRNYLDLDTPGECNLVIGDGFGVMSALLLMHRPERRTILANLTKPLLLDLHYIRRALPEIGIALATDTDDMAEALADERISLIAVRADDAPIISEAAIGLAVNVVSMQEMDLPVVERYFRVLRGNKAARTAFYCCNKLFKVSNFEDYPWHKYDRILHDSLCPWSQWYYSARPPFWHRRRYGEKEIWHRLALLEMDNA